MSMVAPHLRFSGSLVPHIVSLDAPPAPPRCTNLHSGIAAPACVRQFSKRCNKMFAMPAIAARTEQWTSDSKNHLLTPTCREDNTLGAVLSTVDNRFNPRPVRQAPVKSGR